MDIDLIDCIPLDLAGSEDLKELLDALLKAARSIDEWTDRHAEVLDFVYRYRLLRLLVSRRPNDELSKELRMLGRHLRQMTAGHRVAAMARLSRSYPDRWTAFRGLAADRIEMIESDAPDRLLERAHVQDILKRVHRGEFRIQADITDCGDFGSAPNVTRILNMMERNGLIERHKHGRENRLVLTPEGEQAVEPNVGRYKHGKKNYPVSISEGERVAEPNADPYAKLQGADIWRKASLEWSRKEGLLPPPTNERGASYFSQHRFT